MIDQPTCDFCAKHDDVTDLPIGPPCGADATHRILWLDGSRRFSFGCGAHLAMDPDSPMHVVVPLPTDAAGRARIEEVINADRSLRHLSEQVCALARALGLADVDDASNALTSAAFAVERLKRDLAATERSRDRWRARAKRQETPVVKLHGKGKRARRTK